MYTPRPLRHGRPGASVRGPNWAPKNHRRWQKFVSRRWRFTSAKSAVALPWRAQNPLQLQEQAQAAQQPQAAQPQEQPKHPPARPLATTVLRCCVDFDVCLCGPLAEQGL